MRVVLTQPDDVTQVIYDPNFNEAIIMFLSHESAQIAFNKIKNRNMLVNMKHIWKMVDEHYEIGRNVAGQFFECLN